MKKTLSCLLAGSAMFALWANTASALVTNIVSEADTYTRAGVNAGTAENLDNRGFGGGDFVSYIRFNLSSLPIKTITGAELTLYKGVGSRNDGITGGRFRTFGLTNSPGNTPQNWVETNLVDATVNVGAEYTNVLGNQVDTSVLFNLDADLGANVTESINNNTDNPTVLSGPDLTSFVTERFDDDGLVTFINCIDANNRGYAWRSREYTNVAVRPTLTIEYLPDTGLSNIFWTVGSGDWDINGTPNWEDESGGSAVYGPEVFNAGNNVTFEDTRSAGGSISVNLVTTVRPESVTVDTANTYTFTGVGQIAGNGAITKTGSGTLVLNTSNTNYTGTIHLDGGTTVFSTINNLGAASAPISFGGGALQYASGNTVDISSRSLTLDAGGGTIDVGAGDVVFASPIGGGGSGGLTKAGSGTLELSGNNNYSGDTTVAAGTLYLASEFNAGISNSPVITVNSGATLDAGQYELYLNGAIGQKLAGAGTVDTGDGFGFFARANTFVSPGTNGVIGTLTFSGTYGDVQLDGGTLQMDVSSGSHDQIHMIAGSYLYLTNSTLDLNVIGAPLANGTYTLISGFGTLLGDIVDLTVTGYDFAADGQVAFLSDATPGQIDLVIAPLSNNNLVWAGTGSTWDVGGISDWLNGAVASVFQHGDSVTFDSTGAAQPVVSLDALVFPSAVTVNANTDYTINDGGGFVSGTNALTKSGSGKLTINTPNNNSGGTTINAGTVEVGGTGHIGTGPIVNNGTLILGQTSDRTSGGLSGSGSVTRNGSGTVTLSGGATHTGATIISAGTLQIGNGGAIGALQTSSITNGGTLGINSSSSINLSSTPITGTGGLIKGGTGTLQLGGSDTFGDTRLDADGGVVVAGAANQVQGELWVQANSTFDLNGFDQNTAGLRSTSFAGGVVTNSAGTTNTLTVTVENGGNFEDWSGALNGPIRFVKLGSDDLIIRANGNLTGGAVLGEGTMQIRDADHGLGAGTLTCSNGTTFQFDDYPEMDLAVVDGATASLRSRGLGNLWNGEFVGSASSTLWIIDSESTTLNGVSCDRGDILQFENFLGTVIVTNTTELRFSRSSGFAMNGGENTTFDVRGTLHTRNATGGRGVVLGALIGTGNVADFQDAGSTGTARYEIGAKGIDATFTGNVTDDATNNQFFAIVKVGAGTQTLGGSNNWSGSTTVSNGVLAISGAGGLGNNSAIIVASPGVLDMSGVGGTLTLGTTTNAQTLSGDGTVAANVVVAPNGPVTIAPGFSAGALTIAGNLTLGANSTVAMELDNSASPTSDRINADAIIEGGTLTVTNIGPLLSVGQVFTLFNQAVSGFATVDIATNDSHGSYVFTNRLAQNGTIEVLAATRFVDDTATNITFSVSAGNLTLGWPASHIGWTLQAQTNALSAGLSTNWTNLGYESTNSVTFPVNAADPTVFYRLRLVP